MTFMCIVQMGERRGDLPEATQQCVAELGLGPRVPETSLVLVPLLT